MNSSISQKIVVIGKGRLGTALYNALVNAGLSCGDGPMGRGETGQGADVVILCVPDRSIPEASAVVIPGPLVVHTSGASSLAFLDKHDRRGIIHPLLSVPDGLVGFDGAYAALRAAQPSDHSILLEIVSALGMQPLDVKEQDRVIYHTAASLASNALVALQVAASELASMANVPPVALNKLAQASLDQVGEQGVAALTGPAARGDWQTVAAQRDAVASNAPHLLALFDALTTECARLVGHSWSPQQVVAPGSVSSMAIARTAEELTALVAAARSNGARVGFVPTMGGLHEGHATLIKAAASSCNCVITSLFVNPTQFNNAADLAAYPSNEADDLTIAKESGATIVFIPSVDVIYPKDFATSINPGPIADVLEGEHRPGHFDGMATVVARLLGLAQADVAFFGRKDAQQLAIIEQLVRDLAIPTRVQGVDTVREADGLAMSSRNVRLSSKNRVRALALSRGLNAARELAAQGEQTALELERVVLLELAAENLSVDYVSLVDAVDFRNVTTLDRHCILLIAASVDEVRLIDNICLYPSLA